MKTVAERGQDYVKRMVEAEKKEDLALLNLEIEKLQKQVAKLKAIRQKPVSDQPKSKAEQIYQRALALSKVTFA